MGAVGFYSFVGGGTGRWRIESNQAISGMGLAGATRLEIFDRRMDLPAGAAWVFRGVTSNARYTHREERDRLQARQEGLDRPASTRAAMILIKKTEAWWDLSQDQRREIFEEQGRHIEVGLKYLPAIARRLHHSRDLGEPFDFITWFEYAPADEGAFDSLVGELRATREWEFVEREVDIRLARDS